MLLLSVESCFIVSLMVCKVKSEISEVVSAFKAGAVHGLAAAPGSSELPMLFASFGAQHIKFWQTARSGRLSQQIEGRRGAFGCGCAWLRSPFNALHVFFYRFLYIYIYSPNRNCWGS